VRIVAVDTDPKWGLMVTGGSWSVWMTFPVFSRAGAAGRIALVYEGARLLDVPANQCLVRGGAVIAADRSISYAQIIQRGDLRGTFTADELATMSIKPALERRLIGRTIEALDIPAKTNGAARYGIGTIVDPDGALAQVEGSALWGLSMALHEGTEFVKGQVKDTNLDTYTPLRIGDVPELDIQFIDSLDAPVGLGEPATTVIAPAIGNAIFAAVGVRLRHLPIRPSAVLQGLAENR